jgi:hypothetical protein
MVHIAKKKWHLLVTGSSEVSNSGAARQSEGNYHNIGIFGASDGIRRNQTFQRVQLYVRITGSYLHTWVISRGIYIYIDI